MPASDFANVRVPRKTLFNWHKTLLVLLRDDHDGEDGLQRDVKATLQQLQEEVEGFIFMDVEEPEAPSSS